MVNISVVWAYLNLAVDLSASPCSFLPSLPGISVVLA